MNLISLDFCTGCGCCAAVCPQECLDMLLSQEGFYYPVLSNPLACTQCNLCQNVCPVDNPKQYCRTDNSSAFSIITRDPDVLKSTTSGGACFELARLALELGCNVCAVTYDYEMHLAKHSIINNFKQLDDTKGSKYMQSYTVDAFRNLFDGSKFIVFGTPCQIAGVDRAAKLKNMRERFILVDFFCHGTPSIKLWHKYIGENNRDSIEKVNFRSKEYGWKTFSIKFNYENGTVAIDSEGNMFYAFFLNNYCLNNACYNCQFKALNSAADIRVGDFWGSKYKDNNTGVSSMLVFNNNVEIIIGRLGERCYIKSEHISDVIEGQMLESPQKSKYIKIVLRVLDRNVPLKRIYNTILLPDRLRKKLLSMLPGVEK